MQEPRSWRQFIGKVIEDPKEKRRLAEACQVDARTLERWANGMSNPRSHNILQLIEALPQYRQSLIAFISEEFPDISQRLEMSEVFIEEARPDIAPIVYDRVIANRASAFSPITQWGMRSLVLQSCVSQFDAQKQGIAAFLFQCAQSRDARIVRSLRLESHYCEYSRTWEGPKHSGDLFVGRESLAGIVISAGKPEIYQESEQIHSLDFYHTEAIRSVGSYPIRFDGKTAGCLIVLTQTSQFFSTSKITLLKKYADLLALAFREEEFYSQDEIRLHIMPETPLLASLLHEPVKNLLNAEPGLSRREAEQYIVDQWLLRGSE